MHHIFEELIVVEMGKTDTFRADQIKDTMLVAREYQGTPKATETNRPIAMVQHSRGCTNSATGKSTSHDPSREAQPTPPATGEKS